MTLANYVLLMMPAIGGLLMLASSYWDEKYNPPARKPQRARGDPDEAD